jgi:hypothetical protein
LSSGEPRKIAGDETEEGAARRDMDEKEADDADADHHRRHVEEALERVDQHGVEARHPSGS